MNKYIMMGPPGAGKSTQASMLSSGYGLVRISVGDIFRWQIRNHTKIAAKIRRYIDSGRLVPDEIVDEVVKQRLAQHDWNYGFVLDGYPASETQAEFFLESYDVDGVILICVPDEVAKERLQNSSVCQSCGLDYHLIHHHPNQDGLCDICGGELGTANTNDLKTSDDRLSEYHIRTEPVVDLFRRYELVVKIDGTRTTDEIQSQIQVELGLTSEAMAQRVRAGR